MYHRYYLSLDHKDFGFQEQCVERYKYRYLIGKNPFEMGKRLLILHWEPPYCCPVRALEKGLLSCGRLWICVMLKTIIKIVQTASLLCKDALG